jgi:chemotaxis protein MotA
MASIVGIGGICYAIWYVVMNPSTQVNGFYDKSSLILLAIMPPCIVLLSHTFQDFFTGTGAFLNSIFKRQKKTQDEVITVLTHASAIVRSDGLGSLVRIKERVRNELLKDGLSLIVNNFTPEEIKHNISAKISAKQSRMHLAANLFESISKLSPGVGMLGTILGLIQMMANLTDPSKIGGGMATALLTTLYGLLLGNVIYGPIAERIKLESDKALEIDLMVLEGVIGLKGKKSSVHFTDIMKTYGKKAAGGQQRR